MKKEKILIIHAVEQAQDCVEKGYHKGRRLFSTHPSVDVYLKEYHQIECQCLSRYLSVDRVLELRDQASEMVDELMAQLDEKVSPLINKRIRDRMSLNLKYFTCLYGYRAKLLLLSYFSFVEACKKMVQEHRDAKIYHYNDQCLLGLKVETDLSRLFSTFLGQLQIEEVLYLPKKTSRSQQFISRLKQFLAKIEDIHPKDLVRKLVRRVLFYKRVKKFSQRRKTIFLSQPLYDLEFLKDKLSPYNIVYFSAKLCVPYGVKKTLGQDVPHVGADIFDAVDVGDNAYLKLVLGDLKKDFLENFNQWMHSLLIFREIHQKYPIKCGIWGTPPWVNTGRMLLYQYLRSQNIRVIGAQHGGNYAERYHPWYYDSEYANCDDFISYGFTKDDLDRSMQGKKITLNILPFGRVRQEKPRKFRKPIDIVYPMNNSMPILGGGMKGLPPDQMLDRQLKILEYLNSRSDLNIYVKLFQNSDYYKCAVLPVLKRMKNLRVVDSINLETFLCRYAPGVVVLDTPSTPLYQVLSLDAEIFLMDNPFAPFESAALEELQRRVHYSEDIDTFIKMIEDFLSGGGVKKRNDDFYYHYVHKDDSEGNILHYIRDLVNPGEEGHYHDSLSSRHDLHVN